MSCLSEKSLLEYSNDKLAKLRISQSQKPDFVPILLMLLTSGKQVRFKAIGSSMFPIIRNNDIITLSPFKTTESAIGQVIGYLSPGSGKLVVHRVINISDGYYQLKGDGLLQPDKKISKSEIIGIVTSIERNDQIIKFGLGIERFIIAYLSRKNLLKKIYNVFSRLHFGNA